MLVRTSGELRKVRQAVETLKAQVRRLLQKPADDLGLEMQEELKTLMLGLCLFEHRLSVQGSTTVRPPVGLGPPLIPEFPGLGMNQ